MKILVHDYSGHPFQAQLSRELARRGHEVQHVHCASYVSGKGQLTSRPNDPESLSFTALELRRSFDKYTPVRRLLQEFAYARKFLAHLGSDRPDVAVMCNVPLVAHGLIKRGMLARGVPTVFWHQDVYSHAIGLEARRRLGPIGPVVARAADRTEAWIARNAVAVVPITDRFLPVHQRWGTEPAKIHVIPNWGPLDEVAPRPRDNAWARQHGLVGKSVLLYSGTLGLKHDPAQLVALIRGVRAKVDAELVVISDGRAAEWLRAAAEPGLTVLPFQPFEQLSDVLGSGDVLLAILEPEASQYSVPSKALTYLCAGRPVIGLIPGANPVSSVIAEAGGLVIDLDAVGMSTAVAQVTALLTDQAQLESRGRQARAFAASNFDIRAIASRFEVALGASQPPIGLVAEPISTSATITLDTPGTTRA